MLKNRATGKTLTQDLKRMVRDLEQLHNKELPEEAESKLGEIVTESFRQEKYIGGKSGKWKSRKNERRVRKRQRKNILVAEGNLFAAPQPFSGIRFAGVRLAGDNRKDGVLTYGPVHNEGLRAGKSKGFTMPQRQFMPLPGEGNPILIRHLFKFHNKEADRIFNKR